MTENSLKGICSLQYTVIFLHPAGFGKAFVNTHRSKEIHIHLYIYICTIYIYILAKHPA